MNSPASANPAAPREDEPETRVAGAAAGIDLRPILISLFVMFGLQHLLLWRFLDFAPAWLYLAAATLLCAAAFFAGRNLTVSEPPRVRLPTLLTCAAAALLLCMLGGEGNLFYANADWQVRNAILADLVANPWPYAYTSRGAPEILRAPLAMYLMPALAGKALGAGAAHPALLIQNTFFLTAIFATGSTLFESSRARLLALAVFVFFSGMDVIGHFLASILSPNYVLLHHIEGWSTSQYSSHLTQIFWVPHHGFSGWLCAAVFLLWKLGRLRVGYVLAIVPLIMVWSTLVVMGFLPFALYAAIESLRRRAIRWPDIAIPAITSGLSIPAILYLGAGSGAIGKNFYPFGPINYLLFISLEVLVFLTAVLVVTPRSRFGIATLLLVGLCLLLYPFYQIGETIDFTMRASIPALAILAVLVIDAVRSGFSAGKPIVPRLFAYGAVGALLVGSVTGLLEIGRALAYRPVPAPLCTMMKAWDQQDVAVTPQQKVVYVAPVASLPLLIRPDNPALVPDADPPRCWERPWKVPS